MLTGNIKIEDVSDGRVKTARDEPPLFFLFLMPVRCIALKAPIHSITYIHQNAEIKPDDQCESIDERQTQNSGFNPVYKKNPREFDGSKSKNYQQP